MQDDASRAQVLAAEPGASTWLSANAGSGKTRVLIDRVARILLKGTPPQRILCLTYTNAAASEMQNRLFRRLGAWAMMPAPALALALADLGAEASDLAEARRLFARAIETPGGLRIQTIHSFCASLLRRFPLEAQVAPQFTEIDERTRSQLIRGLLVEMAEGAHAGLIRNLGMVFGEHAFFRTVERIADLRRGLVPQDRAEVWAALGLPAGASAAGLAALAVADVSSAWRHQAVQVLATSGVMDQKLARMLADLDLEAPGMAEMEALERVLLNKTGANAGGPKALPTKALREGYYALFEPVSRLAQRAADLRPQRLALLAAEQALALSDFARVFLPLFAEAKARQGWLDFDDLIERAEALLTDPSVAAWVLFRLDGGIDHILVDEAQDTSPGQWRVIDLLTQEFTAGKGARGLERTLFVVGDKKQSIYSFQGADVSGLDARAGQFQAAFRAVGLGFENRDLRHSFRSSPVILNVVDALFGDAYPEALGQDVRHIAFHDRLPGRVEVWPVVPKAEADQTEDDWTDPVDRTAPRAAVVVLAGQIARHIKTMLDQGAPVPVKDGFRAARPGDFLILVRRRSGVFPHLLRACKAAGLPVAGADRLQLADELAVRDLLVLLSVLALPEDDLALASVLRSPLCGWSEADLFALAYDRKGFLWQALRQKGGAALEMISDLRDQADFLRPHDLLDRALTRHRGRVRLLARLGEEAEEAIDALLAQALAYETVEVPSLDGFLAWMQGDDAEIKRQMGEAQDRIRIMTVHGAKGLEGEIVILPDTGDRSPRTEATVLLDAGGLPLWTGVKEDRAPVVSELVEVRRVKEAEESLRLLYVALTRAKSQLIIAAAGEAKDDSWHGLVTKSLTGLGGKADGDGRLVLQKADWPGAQGKAASAVSASVVTLPDWTQGRVPAPTRQVRPLSPSALGGARSLPGGLADETATDRGTALHLMLQHLPGQPPARWPLLAQALVPDDVLRKELMPHVERLILDPGLALVFGIDSLAEVAICGSLNGRMAEGAIDRLVVAKDHVLAVDFKSNPQVPDNPAEVPESILRQMGAYAALLAQAWPDHVVQTAVLWTETGQLMVLPDDMVRDALQRATSDGADVLDEVLSGA